MFSRESAAYAGHVCAAFKTVRSTATTAQATMYVSALESCAVALGAACTVQAAQSSQAYKLGHFVPHGRTGPTATVPPSRRRLGAAAAAMRPSGLLLLSAGQLPRHGCSGARGARCPGSRRPPRPRASHPTEPPAPPLRASAGVRSAQAAAHASCTAQRLPHARMAAALPKACHTRRKSRPHCRLVDSEWLGGCRHNRAGSSHARRNGRRRSPSTSSPRARKTCARHMCVRGTRSSGARAAHLERSSSSRACAPEGGRPIFGSVSIGGA